MKTLYIYECTCCEVQTSPVTFMGETVPCMDGCGDNCNQMEIVKTIEEGE